MANRITGSVIIVDSAMGNANLLGVTGVDLANLEISSIAFWAASTLGNCIITGANTTDAILNFSYVNAGSGIVVGFQSISFGEPLSMDILKCPTLTAGTAWVYLA